MAIFNNIFSKTSQLYVALETRVCVCVCVCVCVFALVSTRRLREEHNRHVEDFLKEVLVYFVRCTNSKHYKTYNKKLHTLITIEEKEDMKSRKGN
jgi:hypothetical protein